MGKVFGLRELELQPGASEVAAEELLCQWAAQPQPQGLRVHILKGNRGERDGKYVILTEMESVTLRDRYWPTPDEESEDIKTFVASHPEWSDIVARILPLFTEQMPFTDYEIIS